MTHSTIRMMLSVVAAIVLGFLSYPVGEYILNLIRNRDTVDTVSRRNRNPIRPVERPQKVPAQNEEIIISDNTVPDDQGTEWEHGFDDTPVAGPTETEPDPEDASFKFSDGDPELVGITEERDAPEVPGQTNVVPEPPSLNLRGSLKSAASKLASALERSDKRESDNYTDNEFSPQAWSSPRNIYAVVSKRVLNALGTNPSLQDVIEYLSEPSNRRDLAVLSLCRKAGIQELEQVTAVPMGANVVAAVASDLSWLTNVLYSGPCDNLAQGMRYLAEICASRGADLNEPVTRRIATTTALEFARENWGEEDMLRRYTYYASGYKEGKLNSIFDNLAYWETRLVTGCTECSGWGSPESLAWQRDNVRLTDEGYLSACTQLAYRLRNVAGDSVFSSEYLDPIRAATDNIIALAHREIGGVCGACSHYGAYGALAAGIPAMTMDEPGHCAYTVRIGKEWKMSYSIYWQHGMHKNFWKMRDWEFLILTQDLYDDRYNTLASDLLADAASFLAARRFTKTAVQCFDASVQVQPRNWAAWLAFAGYLKQKAPNNSARWVDLCNRMIDDVGEQYHDVSATFQARFIFPQLIPLTSLQERNKLFTAFFRKCKDYGIAHWDIAPLLDAQLAGCKNDRERLIYIRTVLSALMSKSAYSGAALAWGLGAAGRISEACTSPERAEKFQKDFSRLLTGVMGRMGKGKKDAEATWAGLGEAIHAAAKDGDTGTFQAIGKIAMNKCKRKFPKYKFKFRGFSGKVISAKGLITTATTLDEGGVRQACLHWGVLQKTGGAIPFKFEGKNGITVKFDKSGDLSGIVAIFDCAIKKDRPFRVESSDDGQNWTTVQVDPEISDKIMRFDLKDSQASARFVRLLREGDKWENGHIVGFYVYGKPRKG